LGTEVIKRGGKNSCRHRWVVRGKPGAGFKGDNFPNDGVLIGGAGEEDFRDARVRFFAREEAQC
jgi:hypothetical protein